MSTLLDTSITMTTTALLSPPPVISVQVRHHALGRTRHDVLYGHVPDQTWRCMATHTLHAGIYDSVPVHHTPRMQSVVDLHHTNQQGVPLPSCYIHSNQFNDSHIFVRAWTGEGAVHGWIAYIQTYPTSTFSPKDVFGHVSSTVFHSKAL